MQPTSLLFYRLSTVLALSYAAWFAYALVTMRSKGVLPFRGTEVFEFLLVLCSVALFVTGLIRDEQSKDSEKTAWALIDENLERYAMLIAYVFVCVVIVQEVIRRYVFNYSSAWAQETAQYLFIYLGYVGAAYAVKERAHIRFDVLLNRVSPTVKGWLYIVGDCATLVFAVIAIYWSGHTIAQLLNFGGTTPVLRINKSWFECAVPLGFALIVFRCLQGIVRDWKDIQSQRAVFAGKAMFDE